MIIVYYNCFLSSAFQLFIVCFTDWVLIIFFQCQERPGRTFWRHIAEQCGVSWRILEQRVWRRKGNDDDNDDIVDNDDDDSDSGDADADCYRNDNFTLN